MLKKPVRRKFKELKPVTKKPVLPGVLVLFVIVLGTGGYHYLWLESESTILDAFYMTWITIATIGYSEVHPLTDVGKIFTILLSIAGIGSLFYVMSVLMENLFIIQLHDYRGKKKKMKEIEKLRDHIIVAGYGRVGQLATNLLITNGEQFVVIDDDFIEDDIIHSKRHLNKVVGDATQDSVLIRSGIERAKGMIVATGNSATTVFVVLSAKVLNPNIFIVARADEDSDTEKLIRAGADKIVNPYSIGGQRMANLILNNNIVDFLDSSFESESDGLRIEKLNLATNSILINKTLKKLNLRTKFGITVLAVMRDRIPHTNLSGNYIIKENDQLIILGTVVALKQFEEVLILNKF